VYVAIMATDAPARPVTYSPTHLVELYMAATAEAVDAILAKLAEGKVPERDREAQLTVRDNGMPYLIDPPLFSANGPIKYSSVLEPPYGDDEARSGGMFPAARFPSTARLKDYILRHHEKVRAFSVFNQPRFVDVWLKLQIESCANQHCLRFGEVPSTRSTIASVLKFIVAGLFDERLDLAIVVPIALTRFGFDRLRLTDKAYILRMNDALQKVRWSGKAYGANGHDAVLGAATHALVLTGWGIGNTDHFELSSSLSKPTEGARQLIDGFFAAMRIVTGIDTGYAQEIRVARRWRTRHHLGRPEMFAVGARRYPSAFDDFGWSRTDLPEIGREQLKAVAALWSRILQIDDDRLNLALRRLNAAMTRDEASDAILDATIALEILLGGGDGQAINWKLRMRAGALASLDGGSSAAEEAFEQIGAVYEARSAIVHGSKRRKTVDADHHRTLAVDGLRKVLEQVITRPEYLDPKRIDREIMLGSRSDQAEFPGPAGELEGEQVESAHGSAPHRSSP